MSDNVKEFSTDDFKSEVVESDTPVLVDFGPNGVALVGLSLLLLRSLLTTMRAK